eukprot:5592294-Ditylum_brightwellii.AAC.1
MHDGMYYPKLHDHYVWLEHVKKNQEECRKKRDKQPTDPSPSDTPSGSQGSSTANSKLMRNGNLKAILCTNCAMSEEQIQEM